MMYYLRRVFKVGVSGGLYRVQPVIGEILFPVPVLSTRFNGPVTQIPDPDRPVCRKTGKIFLKKEIYFNIKVFLAPLLVSHRFYVNVMDIPGKKVSVPCR